MRYVRSPVDNLGDDASFASGLDTSGWDDVTRQEFKEDCDINTILQRFGAGDARPFRFGDALDADLDLQNAIESVRSAQHSFDELPPELRSRYRDISSLVDALNRGELVLTTEPPPTPSGPDGVSPSGNGGEPPAGA